MPERISQMPEDFDYDELVISPPQAVLHEIEQNHRVLYIPVLKDRTVVAEDDDGQLDEGTSEQAPPFNFRDPDGWMSKLIFTE
jgi:hypothetical protein